MGTNVLAKAPSRVNTIVKPAMNNRIGVRGRRWASPAARSPVTNDTYPGTRGSTHGEAKETAPATKASAGAHHDVRPVWTMSAIMRAAPAALGVYGSRGDGSAQPASDSRSAGGLPPAR